jgi:hypothetical protein
MADQVNIAPIARQPSIFKMGMDFPTWFRQFVNYCTITNTPAAQRYGVMCSFLDSSAFTTVENLRLADDVRANINAAFEPLRVALHSPDSRIPARFAIRHRAQREEESLDEFARELEKLARNAFPDDNNIRTNQTLIDAFIAGLRSDELSIKLLQRNFDNVTEALNEAKEYLAARDTRKYLKRNSARSEILVNRAALHNSESYPSPARAFPNPGDFDQQLLTENHQRLTENRDLNPVPTSLVAQNNVVPTHLGESGARYHPTNPFVNNQPPVTQQPQRAAWDTTQHGIQPSSPHNGMAILTCYYCGGINHTKRFCMLYNRHFSTNSGNQNRGRYNNGNNNRGRSYNSNRDYNNNNRGGTSQQNNNNSAQDFQNRNQNFPNRN